MAAGDHFFVWRWHWAIGRYRHHGIDIGDGTAVHFTDGGDGVAGPGGDAKHFQVQRTPITAVTRDGQDRLHVVEHSPRLEADETVGRAIKQVGRRNYSLIFDNCEHFASWCACDRYESVQVSAACTRVGSAGVKAIAVGTVHVAAKLGVKRTIRGASGWMLVADAAQWATEAGGHHVGLREPGRRKNAGRAVGATTAVGLGMLAGPAGALLAGGLWCAGEIAGELSHAGYERARQKRLGPPAVE